MDKISNILKHKF